MSYAPYFRAVIIIAFCFSMQFVSVNADNHTFCDRIDNDTVLPLIFDSAYYESQVNNYSTILIDTPNDVEMLTLRGDSYLALRLFDNAISDFILASELDRTSTYALARLGDLYQQTFQIEAAIDSYSQAIALDANYAYAYIKRGTVYRKLGDASELEPNALVYSLALNDLNTAVRLDRNSALAYARRSEVFLSMRNSSLALQDALTAINIGSDFAFSHVVLASIYKSQGNFRAASDAIQQALNTPSDTVRSYSYALSMRGEMCWRLGAHSQAITDLKTAFEYDRDFASTYIVLARVAIDMGRYSETAIVQHIGSNYDGITSLLLTFFATEGFDIFRDKPVILQYLQVVRYNPTNPFVYRQLESLNVNPAVYQDSYAIFQTWLAYVESLEPSTDIEEGA